MKLLTSKLIASNNTEHMCVIDLQDYLPPKVIKEISRKDGTKFKYVKFNTGNITKESVLRQRVGELVHWAKGLKYWGEEEVHLAVTVKFGNGGGNEADGKNDGSESEEDHVATMIQPIRGAKVRTIFGETMMD